MSKFKAGDKVRRIENEYGTMRKGRIVTVKEYEDYGGAFFSIEEEKEEYRWYEDAFELVEYSFEDFKKAPVGTKITFESGKVLVKDSIDRFENSNTCMDYDNVENFKSNYEGKIIKIEEPTAYKTVYEYTELEEENKRLQEEA